MQQIKSSSHWNSYQWVGVHMRRSDHLVWYNDLCHFPANHNPYAHELAVAEYVKPMKEMHKAFSCSPVPIKFFLATDDVSVEAQVAKWFPDGKLLFNCSV